MNKRELEENEKELIAAFFNHRATGFYVEVGANHPRNLSHTWHLEEKGWRSILIEAQSKYAELLRQQRENSLVFQVACSSPENTGKSLFHIAKCDDQSGLKKSMDDPDVFYDRSEIVDVKTLDQILESVGNPSIDCIFIDVEGTELDVLKGFDLKKNHPLLVVIEDKVHGLAKHKYLKRSGYKLVRRTDLNNWYVPQDSFFKTPLSERIELFRKMYSGTPIRKMQLRMKRIRKWLRK